MAWNNNCDSSQLSYTNNNPVTTLDSSNLMNTIELLTQNQTGMQLMALEFTSASKPSASPKICSITSRHNLNKYLFDNLPPQSQQKSVR